MNLEEVMKLMKSDGIKLDIETNDVEVELNREKIIKERKHMVKRLKEEFGIDVNLTIK